MSGKGDTPRPYSVDYEQYSSNWERALGKTGKIYGSCGHELACIPDDSEIVRVATLDSTGKRVVSYPTPCLDCWKAMETAGSLLHSLEDVMAWLAGEKEFTPW